MHLSSFRSLFVFFFFNDTAPTEIYTLSLHDALPIYRRSARSARSDAGPAAAHEPVRGHAVPHERVQRRRAAGAARDRKSTRLNSSHEWISYAVFCLKKKKKSKQQRRRHEQNKATKTN